MILIIYYVFVDKSIHKLSADGRWWRFGQRQGNPFTSKISSIGVTYTDDTSFIWVSSNGHGVARIEGNALRNDERKSYKGVESDPWTWLFYSGHRYFPDNNIHSVLSGFGVSDDDNVLLCIGEVGLTLLDIRYLLE